MDRFTIRNLELLTPSREGNPTLLSILDHTQTPMGGRRLKRWMLFPLVEHSLIQERLDAVDFLFNHPNTAPFVSYRLIQLLVKSNPSPAYVGRVAAAFANNGQGVRGDFRAVIKAILIYLC